jgi:hypothetical protein
MIMMVWGVEMKIDNGQQKLYQVDPKTAVAVPHTDFDTMYYDKHLVIGVSDNIKYIIDMQTGLTQLDKRSTYPNLLSGTWTNELNSTLKLQASDDGQLSGLYQSAVGPVQGWYSLTGQYDSNAIQKEANAPITTLTFNVLWANENGDLQSITTWNGQLLSDGNHLYMGWLLVAQSQSDRDVWGSLQFGVDQFTKTSLNV